MMMHPVGTRVSPGPDEAQLLPRGAAARGAPDSGRPLTTFAVRHRRGLDVAFLLDSTDGDFQIGLGAASEDFRSVLTLGVDQEHGRAHAVSEWIIDGRTVPVPIRILHRSSTVILVEAAHLPLERRPASLKCWSFLRRQGVDHHAEVIDRVSPALSGLPPVGFVTDPRSSPAR
ncbi:hypothetical protein [Rathayibacter sp. VKM Ac-2857]|uniref:hypothetical protein n=1 Tax=Rathayibacter sp. VKM Ac-2857 TaxID=2739020 RepID=UPI001565298E|nr:hypothetical protein [Rathayibacter sp. VKM Ac-2857]NQX17918.1 hypothetical protein [Rathayibacter sp. VKM Ac-2857]